MDEPVGRSSATPAGSTTPRSFRPDRWADGLAQRLHRYAYFPFGGGPRVCIGNQFAQMEAVLLLATIARRFRPVVPGGTVITPVATMTLRPENGVPGGPEGTAGVVRRPSNRPITRSRRATMRASVRAILLFWGTSSCQQAESRRSEPRRTGRQANSSSGALGFPVANFSKSSGNSR